jgi:hypothetical protein
VRGTIRELRLVKEPLVTLVVAFLIVLESR